MMNFFRKHMRVIFIVTIVAFVGGTFIGAGSYFFGPNTHYAAKVNGSKIPTRIFQALYENVIRASNSEISEQNLNEIKARIMQSLIQDEIFYQQSKIYGIVVTDEELRADLQNSEMFKYNNVFSKNKYRTFLTLLQMNSKEYELVRKKQIAGDKLAKMLLSSAKIWSYELEEATKQDVSITRNALKQTKMNVVLNEWYSNITKNSKIIGNNLVFAFVFN